MANKETEKAPKENLNFIAAMIEEAVNSGQNEGRVHTRFPPEPNGHLHIGHAKAICLDFGMAKRFGGKCNLRFDDTNPTKERTDFVDGIKEDIQWLGFDWEGREYYTSDYFQQLWDFALSLINKGLAYIDEQSADTISQQKGTPTEDGQESPFRNRPKEESIALFNNMNSGELEEGACVLRAKIDMKSPNMHMRDPIIYRIIKMPHHRTGTTWNAYPMYDFAHGQSDYFEGITHSLCTLEFEVHRPLYNWFIEQLKEGDYRPTQTEFNRLNLTYTVMSKRKLMQLVEEAHVEGWDDPRMPTLSGMRRRGYTSDAIKNFIDRIGYTKVEATNDFSLLEFAVREDLNKKAPRVNAVLNPLKLIITNYPEDKVEMMSIINNPEDEAMGSREVPFTRELYIEREDFMEEPPRKFFRLGPDREVRLKGGYIIKCEGYKKNESNGEIEEVYCTYDPETRSGLPGSNRKVKGLLHWVSVSHALDAQVHLYDRLFLDENPLGHKDKDFLDFINPESLKTIVAKVEPSLASAKALDNFQFQRIGYFNIDKTSRPGQLVFNRTVGLRDSWAKKK